MNIITDIFQFMNEKAEAFFEWAQANPKFSHLLGVIIIAFWLTGVLLRWKWACQWTYWGKLWFFDDCKPKTKRRIYIVLLSTILILCLIDLYFLWSES